MVSEICLDDLNGVKEDLLKKDLNKGFHHGMDLELDKKDVPKQDTSVKVREPAIVETDYSCINSEDRIPGLRRKYCPHEVTALVMGVQKYADDSCPWSCILADGEFNTQFHGRTGVDLKDKWRTLIKNRPEFSKFMEHRKTNRKYRPFLQEEEQALIEGVRQYSGERNIWSMILEDPTLGSKFKERSNIQLKDKFRTMKRAGQIIEVPPSTAMPGTEQENSDAVNHALDKTPTKRAKKSQAKAAEQILKATKVEGYVICDV